MKRLNKGKQKQLEKLTEKLTDAALAYNAVRAEFEEFREETLEEMEGYFEDRSENWQEGEAGAAYEAFKDAWQEECAEECTEDVTEYPEEVES